MTWRRIILTTVVALSFGVLAACGAYSGSEMLGQGAPAEAPAPAPSADKEVAASEYAAGLGALSDDVRELATERMIIWSADISLTVEDTGEAMSEVQTIGRSLGGYTLGSESWLSDDQLHARLTIRVPADRFEQAMSQLRDLGTRVTRESSQSEDVSDQYVDLDSRLRHLEAKESQLIEFLERAEDTEALLAVYDHLSQTQGEIEQVKGRMAYLENLAAMATIGVELDPEESGRPLVDEGWKPGHTLRSAARTLVSTLERLGDLLIWLAVYLLPILLLLALPLVALIWLVRRRRRGRRNGST